MRTLGFGHSGPKRVLNETVTSGRYDSSLSVINALGEDSFRGGWQFLSDRPCNVPIEGTAAATDGVLQLLRPLVREPTVWHRPPATLTPPNSKTRTPIVREAAELNGDQQRALLAWMSDAQGSQIVATSSRTLYPLVEAGLFDASLYYRLNVVLLRIAAPRQEATPNAVCVGAVTVSPAE